MLRVDLREPAHLAVIREACAAGRQLELHYYSASSDRESTRIVDPVSVRLIEGHWYLDGYCHNVEGMRRFRVDRVSAARPTGEPACHRGEDAAPDDDRDAPQHRGLRPRARGHRRAPRRRRRRGVDHGAAAHLPARARPDGRTGVTLAVASTVWFGRLLLRLGPHAEVLDPPELAETGRQAARQLLARYRPARVADEAPVAPGLESTRTPCSGHLPRHRWRGEVVGEVAVKASRAP